MTADRMPCRQQDDRDALDDHDVASGWPDRIGSGPHAVHEVEVLAG